MATTLYYTLSIGTSNDNSKPAEASNSRRSLNLLKLADCPISQEDVLNQIRRLEKRTFPKDEAMNFDAELKKRNTELIVVLDLIPPSEAVDFTISEANRKPPKSLLNPLADLESTSDPGRDKITENDVPTKQNISTLVVAYALHTRSAGVDLLHKVCVAENYRRQGVARQMLVLLKSKLEGQGCERIQLWVDWQRDPAIELYKGVGFRRIDGARDYYGPDRHGIKMAIDLNWVW